MSLIARPRILVTGFGPFPGMPENPTSEIVRSLPRRLMGLMMWLTLLARFEIYGSLKMRMGK